MIAFGCCVGRPETFARHAQPGLAKVVEADSVLAETSTTTSIHEAYNEILDAFTGYEGLEALVLLHEDVELLDGDFCDRVRAALADPSVAITGAVGASGVTSLAWWEGRIAGRAWETRGVVEGGFDSPDVDTLDGLLLVLSPWAVDHLRCDTARYTGFHGYDAELCFAARAAGRRVTVSELNVFHHTKGGFGDRAAYDRTDAAFQHKWGLSPVRATEGLPTAC